MIDLTNIKKTYSNAKDNAYTALKQISLSIDKKKFTCITGKSGSGKTTLLKIMAGLLEPDEGTVLIDNVNIYNLSKNKLAKHRNRTIGFVFQDFFLEENFTVYQNVVLITHDLNDAQKADEIFTLADGEITKHEILW
ncbi:MAG: ATP-binding cassette domain-containing protein [Clostridiales bacterium]|nr:ATP-binding cassette domain-containing protein [Clostridiales bacterium]